MGADFLVAALVHDRDVTLNWDAVPEAVSNLSEEALVNGLGGAYGEAPEALSTARAQVRDLFGDLRNLLEGEHSPRDVTSIEVRGATVILSGGMSWGDEPTDTFALLCNVGYFPTVLAAVGFESDETNAIKIRLEG